jgi:two-component system, NarL family, sensor kinase
LRLSIRDDGVGFDTKKLPKSKGLGLISMQERVRLLRGTLSLASQPGKGVGITIRVPHVMEKQA